jgi:hypothetical protein
MPESAAIGADVRDGATKDSLSEVPVGELLRVRRSHVEGCTEAITPALSPSGEGSGANDESPARRFSGLTSN